jgi:hypothetical protein
LQFVWPWHAVMGLVAHMPPLPVAVPMQLAQESVLEFTEPGVAQYSVAHFVAHGPEPLLQTQSAMSWKNWVEPPAQSVWQQSTHACPC